MANKTIPELPEIDLGDLEPTHLLLLETGVETFKLRLSTLISQVIALARVTAEVELDGMTTGVTSVDVSALVPDAQVVDWTLKDPDGQQIWAEITTPDAETVEIDTGDFALAAGTYVLLGV